MSPMKITVLSVVIVSFLAQSLVLAEAPMESYIARIDVHNHSTPTTKKHLKFGNDRFGQDRANCHRSKVCAAEDQGNEMFHSKEEFRWF